MDGHDVQQAENDADTMIVSSAHELCHKTETVVISDDTDILVLMIYHFRDDLKDLYFYSETSARSKKAVQYTSIATLTKQLWHYETLVVCACLVRVRHHTAAIFGHGKGEILKHLQQSKAVRKKKLKNLSKMMYYN